MGFTQKMEMDISHNIDRQMLVKFADAVPEGGKITAKARVEQGDYGRMNSTIVTLCAEWTSK